MDASRIRPGAVRAGSSEDGDTQSNGHQPRVPTPVDPQDLLAAFQTGDPTIVYREAQKLVAAYESAQTEVARLRFSLNFGTAVCGNCDGLHAGPDVVATCYQTKECRYTNVRAGTKKQLRVLDHLLDKG